MTNHVETKNHWSGFADLIDDLVSQQQITPNVAGQLLRELKHCREVDEVERAKVFRAMFEGYQAALDR